jgi:hypothetical protein
VAEQASSSSELEREAYAPWWRRLGRSVPVIRDLSVARTRFLLLLCFFAGLGVAATQMLAPGWLWQRARRVAPAAITTNVSKFWLPIVMHENLYRPKFNREIYTASTWPDGTVWLGGEQAFLAYSRDRGETWACLHFDRLQGVFTSPQSCGEANDSTAGTSATATATPLLDLPRVFAAQKESSTLPLNAQVPFDQRNPTRTTSATTGVDDQQILLSELSHDFGDVNVGKPAKLFYLQARGTPATKGVRIHAKLPLDSPFKLLGKNECQLTLTGVCDLTVQFFPEKFGAFRTDLMLLTEPLNQPSGGSFREYIVSLQGFGQTSASNPAVTQSVPESTAKKAVSTGKSETQTYVPGDVLDIALVRNVSGALDHELVMASGLQLVLLVQRNIHDLGSAAGEPWLRPVRTMSDLFAGKTPAEEAQWRLTQDDRQPCPKPPAGETLLSAARSATTLRSLSFTSCRGLQHDSTKHLNAILKHSATTGYAVGGTPGHGIVYRIDMDEQLHPTFTPLTRDAATESMLLPISLKLPPPWLLTLIVLCLFVGWIVSIRSPIGTKQGIEAMAVNDRPLEANDADAVRLRAVADGISRFFRNPSTRAPLVLCINGQWGSGKSSLMNLLADDLLNQQHTVIPFNAWHHQSEERILASLLQAVRQNALHSPWTLSGAWTRLRIFLKRWPERWFVSVAFSLATMWTVLLAHDFLVVGRVDPSKIAAFIPAFVTTLVTLRTIAQGFTGFLSNPASLLATNGRGSKSELEDQTTLRESFARDFGTVTQVLGNGKLILLIDDLDRCSPEKIRDVVEAMNFLVTAGECYIVLGMARQVVEYYLGQSFSKAIEAMPAQLLGLTEDEVKVKGVRDSAFAKLYLQKLIQLQFNLLPFTEAQAITLLQSGKKTPSEKADLIKFAKETRDLLRWEDRLRRTQRTVQRWFLPVMGTLLLLFGALHTLDSSSKWVWTQVSPYLKDTKVAPASEVPPAAKAPATATSGLTVPGSSPLGADGLVQQNQDINIAGAVLKTGAMLAAPTAAIQPPIPPNSAFLPVHDAKEELTPEDVQLARTEPGVVQVLLLVLVLGGGMWLLAQWWLITRPDMENARDSKEFLNALQDWAPALLSIYKTPRGLKQFLNSVRFLAMLQRSQLEPAEGAERQPFLRRVALMAVVRRDVAKRYGILASLKAEARAGLNGEPRIPDELLVTLAVLHANTRIAEQSRAWFAGGKGFSDVSSSIHEKRIGEALEAAAKRGSSASESALEQLRASLAQYEKAFCKLNGQTE